MLKCPLVAETRSRGKAGVETGGQTPLPTCAQRQQLGVGCRVAQRRQERRQPPLAGLVRCCRGIWDAMWRWDSGCGGRPGRRAAAVEAQAPRRLGAQLLAGRLQALPPSGCAEAGRAWGGGQPRGGRLHGCCAIACSPPSVYHRSRTGVCKVWQECCRAGFGPGASAAFHPVIAISRRRFCLPVFIRKPAANNHARLVHDHSAHSPAAPAGRGKAGQQAAGAAPAGAQAAGRVAPAPQDSVHRRPAAAKEGSGPPGASGAGCAVAAACRCRQPRLLHFQRRRCRQPLTGGAGYALRMSSLPASYWRPLLPISIHSRRRSITPPRPRARFPA